MTVDQGAAPATSPDAQSATVSALESGSGGGQGQAPAQRQGQAAPAPAQAKGAQEGSGLANPFLEGVAPEDRAVVEKYIKNWDAGVTQKFQELHGQLAPWQELGAEPETVSQAMQLMEMINEDPEAVVGLLQQALGESEDPQGQEGQQAAAGGDPMASLPPEFVEQFNQMREVLEALAGDHLSQRDQREQAQQDQELDQTLAGLKEQFGDFDEEYVLAKMIAGQEPEAAVKAFQTAIQGQVNARSKAPNVPAILGGGGAAPQGGTDIKAASGKDVRNLVANLLSQSAQT